MEMMNKSTTNRDSADYPYASIVSRTTVGKRVLVNGHFGGVLRYLGTVAGKEGLYCGVELDQRVGKNDGTYGGVVYFECPPGHGIFAPSHKVQPELCVESSSRPIPVTAQRHQQQQRSGCNGKRMVSSAALPSSSGSSTVTPPPVAPLRSPPASACPSSAASARPPLPPMDWSLMSLGSTNSDGSAGHFNIFDEALMANSQVTYTVFDSDCLMLSDLELTDSTVLRLDEDESDGGEGEEEEDTFHQNRMFLLMEEEEAEETKRSVAGSFLDRSVILDGPTLNLALPVIGSNKMRAEEENEETPTPMVEMSRTDDFRRERDEDRLNRNHLRLEFAAKSEPMQKTTTTAQQQNANNNNSSSTSGVDRRGDGGLSVISQKEEQQNNNNNRNDGERQRRGEETQQQQQRKETPKRPRASLFPSAPSANPMRTKCKAPSKSQMIMDQLKASIEAEKQRAKRKKEEEEEKRKRDEEEKKRKEEREEEEKKRKEAEEEEKKKKGEEEKKRTMDAERNELNEKVPTESTANLTTMEQTVPKVKEVKPRRSLLAPAPQQRPPLPRASAQSSASTPTQVALPRSHSRSRITPSARPVLSSRENTSIALKGTAPMSGMTRRSMTTKSQSVEHVAVAQKHLSGIGRNIANGRTKESKSANASDRQRKEVEDELNRTKQMLKHTTKTLDVFAVVASHFDRKLDNANTESAVLMAQKGDEAAQHQRAIAELECNWKKRLQRAKEEHRVEIDELRAKTSAERAENIAKIQLQHQKTVNELEKHAQKLGKKLAEQEEKHRRELTESASQSTNRLHKELESRNYELQMKNEEMFKLRQANRELQFEVDKLPEKEAQIVKLEARIGDLRDEVNKLRQLQKKLIVQLEAYQHELNNIRVKADAAVKEKEVLEYQLNGQNGGEANGGTPRTRKSFAVPSVSASTPPNRTPETQRKRTSHLSMSCHSNGKANTPRFDMSRSMDSSMIGQSLIACYIQEGRSKPQNTPTKIYTPRDVTEIPPDSSSNGRRVVNFDSTREDNEEPNRAVDSEEKLDPSPLTF
ncbi:hypothetical protein niasHT_007424 [Heterodera trifolii]|uniref:CAP-Gly domain-containing protein n=1 Tax=Heterodera trifolii TaxID=157864 RepID=A0ABD2LP83_9BILA